MRSLFRYLSMAFCALAGMSGSSAFAEGVRTYDGSTALEWAERLTHSEMTRVGNTWEKGGTPRSRWDYSPSVFVLATAELASTTGKREYWEFARRTVASFVEPDGSINGYKIDEYNIDQVNPGKVLLALHSRAPEERFVKAAALLRSQMATHPRTSEGGFWHKKRYPHQMWLDGLYMGSPFLARYAAMFDEPALFDDVAKQIILMDKYAYDVKSGLYFHGWDESREQPWADKRTGLSPGFWSRSIGWYAMAIVDVLDYLPASHPDREKILAILGRVADGVVRWQDVKSGLWWQVTDQGDRAGNYLEASGSSMFVYSLAKAVNRGYLRTDRYRAAIETGFAGLVRELIKVEGDHVSLTQVCTVAGLGGNSQGRPRDGTFDYYVREPIGINDPKGTGPFVLAGIEVDRMERGVDAGRVTGWESLLGILARIKAPTFAARDFPITDFGAVADGSTDATAAIAKAIDACHAAGGGRVVVAGGVFLTGAVHLKSNVNLHVAEGATLKFDPNPKKYLPVVLTRFEGTEVMNYSPLIYAFAQENIAITGKGTLDGSASTATWWGLTKLGENKDLGRRSITKLLDEADRGVPVAQRIYGDGWGLRPNFVEPYRCRNVLIEGVRIVNSPMWVIHPTLCTNVTVRGVAVVSHGPNNDGCDPDSSRDVLIEDCLFDTGDDCIAIKSGKNDDGRRVGVPSENIIIRRCEMKDGHGGVVMGSEVSGSVRNVFVEDCRMDSPDLDRALRFKSNTMRGGVIENVFARNVTIGRVVEAVVTVDFLYDNARKGPHRPVVRNVHLNNVTSTSSPRVLYVRGIPQGTIDGIYMTDCTFSGVEATEVVSGAGMVVYNRVTIEPVKKTKSANSVGGL